MTKWTKPSSSGVCWPAEWDEGEGWPSVGGGPTGLAREPRKWGHLTDYHLLGRLGVQAEDLLDDMGWVPRTLDRCRKKILDYHNRTGKRPTQDTPEFQKWANWIRSQGTTLFQECRALGLTDFSYTRTLDQCHLEIQKYHRKTGECPTTKTSKFFRRWDLWLTRKGSTLAKECKILGIAVNKDFGRTKEDGLRAILDYYRQHGKRPSQDDLRAWGDWFYRNGTSLREECDKLRLPGGMNLTRTLEQARKDILAYYRKTRTRPSAGTPEFEAWKSWLFRNGTTLPKECDKLGLPRAPRRTL